MRYEIDQCLDSKAYAIYDNETDRQYTNGPKKLMDKMCDEMNKKEEQARVLKEKAVNVKCDEV